MSLRDKTKYTWFAVGLTYTNIYSQIKVFAIKISFIYVLICNSFYINELILIIQELLLALIDIVFWIYNKLFLIMKLYSYN